MKLFCECGHNFYWCSQPKVNGTYIGNVVTAASIVFGGGTFTQFKSIANAMKLQLMSSSSFYNLQRKYVHLTINFIYKRYQKDITDECKERQNIEVSGDGRCDSPGYNAKYGTYSIMDQLTNKIIHFHVVNLKETSNSNAMEMFGLKKVLEKVESFGIDIDCLTTDEHPSIKKYLRKIEATNHVTNYRVG